MPATVIVGAQWGDEGKGKLTDILADHVDYVVRYQGGDNAGHTIVHGDETFKLHLIPSGVLYPGIISVIGNGVVVNPMVLLAEIDELNAQGVDTSNIRLSNNAHLVMPYHILLDRANEEKLGSGQIGTTHKGIGPAYVDKASRLGLRVQDLYHEDLLREKLEIVMGDRYSQFASELPSLDAIVSEYLGYAERIRPMVTDTSLLLHKALKQGQRVLLEGAQGTLLDIDHGTYPFVTSSSPCSGGAVEGSGVGVTHVDSVIGILKAYVTRVGSGPFPTEQFNSDGQKMGEIGQEFGTTTGRKRRCGWFDAVLLRYAVRINGITGLALTKLDVLSTFDTISVCIGYRHEGIEYSEFPADQSVFQAAEPRYEQLAGWNEDISGARKFSDLPQAAQDYVHRIEELSGIPIVAVSVGPEKDQTIIRGELVP